MKRIREWWAGLSPLDVSVSLAAVLLFYVGWMIFSLEPEPKPKPTLQVPGMFIGDCSLAVQLPVWEWEDVDRIGRRLPAFTDTLCVRLHWEELD